MEQKNKFYTKNRILKKVSKEEFSKFIKTYPRRLTVDVYAACDPPLVTYNDFELANRWPYSVVASTGKYSDDPNDYYYVPEEEREYTIFENFEDLFQSKTGYAE